MARIRQIKPDFYRHEQLFALEKSCALPVRVAFSGLWTVCDRDGRFRWRPNQLKLDVLPYDVLDFEDVLTALESKQFVISYLVDGEKYGYIPSWKKHQTPHVKEQASTIPAPCKPETTPVQAPVEHMSCTPEYGIRNTDTESGVASVLVLDSLHKPQPVNLPRGEWTDDDTGSLVCRKLKISGIKHPQWISSACPYIRDRMGFKSNQEILDWLPEAWGRYQASDVQFKYGFEKWLAEGHYADDTGPPVKRLRPSEVIALQEKSRAK